MSTLEEVLLDLLLQTVEQPPTTPEQSFHEKSPENIMSTTETIMFQLIQGATGNPLTK